MNTVPVWIADYEDVRRLLSSFIDKIEKGTRLLIRLNPKTMPTLFDHNNQEAAAIWAVLQKLETEHQVLSIETEKLQTGKELYEDAKVRFNLKSEPLVRAWLKRPQQVSYLEQWQSAVQSLTWSTSANIQFLLNNPLEFFEKTAAEVASQCATIDSSLNEPMTLRRLAATFFWGDSKFLDNRLDYLINAFPHCGEHIRVRPVLVNLYIPADYESVLFIENQDTFLMMASHFMAQASSTIAIVYAAGYRGGASRIRASGGYVFSLLAPAPDAELQRFGQWWEQQAPLSCDTWFWGDLDYSGFGILAAMRHVFPDIKAWQPGYSELLRQLELGNGHAINSASKGAQLDPGGTQCEYSDQVLLPAIRRHQQFVDQEAATPQSFDRI